MPKRDFEKLLIEAVDEGLSSLGQSSKKAIYFHLKESFNIKKEEIPFRISIFADAIEKIFGGGACFLEILIMKRLHEKVGGNFELRESTDFAFTEYIAAAKRNVMEKNEHKNMMKEIVQCKNIEIEV